MSLQYGTETKTDAAGATTHATTTAIYQPGKIVSELRQCEGTVRWNNGKLEQAWLVKGIGTTGAVERVDTEWLPVPDTADQSLAAQEKK